MRKYDILFLVYFIPFINNALNNTMIEFIEPVLNNYIINYILGPAEQTRNNYHAIIYPKYSLTDRYCASVMFLSIIFQIVLGFKYRIDRIRIFIVSLLTVNLLLFIFPIVYFLFGDSIGIYEAFCYGLIILLIITTYLYSFILKPLYLKIKNSFNKL